MLDNIYTTDWFGRKNNTTANVKSRLNWKLSGKPYSTFLYDKYKLKELIENEGALTNELQTIVEALDIYASLNIIHDVDTAQTDGSIIEVTDTLSNKWDDDYDNMDIMIGLTLHECSHCLYTDFNYCYDNNEIMSKPVHYIHNIIEDELIEEKLCTQHPGYENFISKLKYSFFDNENGSKVLKKESTDDITNVINIMFLLIRYPKYIMDMKDSSILTKYVDDIVKIKSIMKSCDCFKPNIDKCTIASCRAAYLIWNYLTSKYKYSEDKANTPEIFNVLDNISNKVSSKSEIHSKSGADTYEASIKENRKKAKDGSKETNSTSNPQEAKDVNFKENQNNEHLNEMLYNKYYKEIESAIKSMSKTAIPNATKNIIVEEKFARNGSLDSSRIASAIQGIQTVYKSIKTETKKLNPKYALVIMLDESGSMVSGDANKYASKLAILFLESMKKYKDIEIFIYGHGDNIYKYYGAHSKNKYALVNRNDQMSQNESKSYVEIISDVRKYTKLPIIAVNITDSCYCSNYEKIADIVSSMKNENVFINCICLNNENKSTEKYNKIIYGEGNYLMYNIKYGIKYDEVGTDFAKILYKTCKFK